MSKLAIIVLLLIGVVLGPWGLSFGDPAPAQDNCPLKSISHSEYLRLLAEAKAQDWTVWPGLSQGIFWPSENWIAAPSRFYLEHSISDRLFRFIEDLTFDHASADAQLAAAHAVMRSMHADFVSVGEAMACDSCFIPLPRSVRFEYFIPQRRFAPLCVPCLLTMWYTTIGVVFNQVPGNERYVLNDVIVLNSGLEYTPGKERARNAACPELPSRQPS
jgi:hypothetical protein